MCLGQLREPPRLAPMRDHRVDILQVLALVGRHAGAVEAADLRMLRQQAREHGGATAVQTAQEHHPVAGHCVGSPGTSVRVSKALEMLTEVAALRAGRGRAEYRPQMAAGPHTTAPPPPAQERRRGAGERAHMRFRTITRNARALPDFLLIGGQRCGSTSLYTTLCGHPQVLAGAHKEPHFFDNNHLRGEGFYRRLFPLRAHLRARHAITGEATTHYLSHPAVPERVAAMLPDVRLIAILRDPVERAYSHYQRAPRNGREPLSFEQALAAERERLG